MDRARKARKPLRSTITKTINELEQLIAIDNPDLKTIEEKLRKLEYVEIKLEGEDMVILEEMLHDATVDDAAYQVEFEDVEKYQDKIRACKLQASKVLFPVPQPVQPPPNPDPDQHSVIVTAVEKKRYKLPAIEIKKFSGDLKDWLGWWAQFSKIDSDDLLHATDKFQYLVHATVEGSRARRLVEGYPQSAENYPKVIEALRDRYGDNTMLTELYVRQLASLVIANASKRGTQSLGQMYDELETSLRALETLGVTPDQSAAFLYPLVESSLPEDILRVWQRSSLSGYDEERKDVTVDDRLKALMKFLKQEVKGAERLSFVNAGLNTSEERRPPRMERRRLEFPTAAGLLTTEAPKCIFCGNRHESKDCSKANTLTLEERKGKVKAQNCCFACLKSGHAIKKCRAFVKCAACSRRHHIVMCPELSAFRSSPRNEAVTSTPASALSTTMSSVAQLSTVLLQTLRVTVHGPRRLKVVRALLDSGAQHSYILDSTARSLGFIALGQTELAHAVFGGTITNRKRHNQFTVSIQGLQPGRRISLDVLGQDAICSSLPNLVPGNWVKSLNDQGVYLSDISNGSNEIELLFGADCFGALLTGKMTKVNNELVAIETYFGWTVMGRCIVEDKSDLPSLAFTVITCSMEVQEVDKLWRLDALGILDPVTCKSIEERNQEAERHFNETVCRERDGRYVVPLPWIDTEKDIPSNRAVAVRRLNNATTKLRATDMYDTYDKIFQDWLREGLIELVEEKKDKVHYLPHRPVLKPESLTTPVRPVYDASCKSNSNPSLNDLLHKGPNLIEIIPSLLIRFRRYPVGYSSDIRKAFQMISVQENDQDYQRFLWWNQNGDMVEYRHKRVVFGLTCSPFLLGAVLRHHLTNTEERHSGVARKLMSSIYVDNCVGSLNSVEEYKEFKEVSVQLMATAKMELRQWECSTGEDSRVGTLSGNVRGLESGSATPFTEEEPADSNLLGLRWNTRLDYLALSIPDLETGGITTKRSILSCVAKIFDPMGFLAPALLSPKIILQETWATKLGWDEEVPVEAARRFLQWRGETALLKEIRIPRYAFRMTPGHSNYELHTFCDASSYAYGAAVFVRVKTEEAYEVHLLMAKSRVAPLQKTSIPRLELLSCLIGARLCRGVVDALGETVSRLFWSDSTTAVAWIRRNTEWGTYVGNRVKEIRETTEISEWRHVPGIFNPADLPSRGCSPSELVKSAWWEGPSWLTLSDDQWPVERVGEDEEAIRTEQKKSISLHSIATDRPWYLRKFSTYQSTLRQLAWVRRFIAGCRGQRKSGTLTLQEITDAESTLFRLVQTEVFDQSKTVVDGLRVTKGPDGLLRVRTKIVQLADTDEFRAPVLLPAIHPVVEQLIRYHHSKLCHCGVQILMAKLRESVWIIRARRSIKCVVGRCVSCRRYSSKAPVPPAAPLPKERITAGNPFQVTGVDLAGPLILKNGSKAWIVLYTCAVYRCVYLDLVSSLTTETFTYSLQKFICRRGRPDIIWSDNGTNFRGADNAFKKINWQKVEESAKEKRISWKFIPPTSAWWGGWWERLIRSTKDLLRKVMGNKKLSFVQVDSLLCDVEVAVNERPLTYISDDQDDLVCLTPMMFLHGLPSSSLPEIDVIGGEVFREAAGSLSQFRKELRNRFRKEYLSHLVHRGKSEKVFKALQVGDVVLVGADNKKRVLWPMGKIIEFLPGVDGNNRVARIQVKDGVLLRSVQRLYPLEVSSAQLVNKEIINVSTEEIPQSSSETTTRYGRRIVVPHRLGYLSITL